MKQFTQLVLVALFLNFQAGAQHLSENQARPAKIGFKENKGQISDQFYKPRPDILFSGNDGRLDFYLKNNGVSYQLNHVDSWLTEEKTTGSVSPVKRNPGSVSQITIYRLDIEWLNAAAAPQIAKGEALAGHENYYTESCPSGALGIKSYQDLTYKNIYPGIDLKWNGKENSLKYEYYLAPYSDYRKIQLQYKGAEKIYINKNGELIIKTPLGDLSEQKPYVLQNNKPLEASWVVTNNIVSFNIKNADPSQALVIDPLVRYWGTYYGGSGADNVYTTVTDNLANVYLSGETQSIANIATSGAHQTTYGGLQIRWGDAFLSKFDQNGVRQWATYYGGAEDDFGNYCTVDANGNTFMVGGTSTSNSMVIATPGAHKSTPGPTVVISGNGTQNAFLAKFDAAGIRQWGTYYGGDRYEWAYYVDVNAAGDILMSGVSSSTDVASIATAGCHQPTFGGGSLDGFLVKFDAAGTRQWGTYYGGPGNSQDDMNWCKFASNGDIYMAGGSNAPVNIATPGSHQPSFGGGAWDALLVKFNSAGQRLWGTYYGGTGAEYFNGGTLDASDNVYLTGYSSSNSTTVIATSGAHQTTYGGGTYDALLIKFDPSGVRQWGTYYGGTGNEFGFSACTDLFGNIYFSGFTSSATGTAIASPCAYNPTFNGGSSDLFLTKFTQAGTRIWGTYYGSIYSDNGGTCSTDPHANVYLCGSTLANSGTVLATSGAHQTTYGGGIDGFLAKFNGCIPALPVNTTPPANLMVCQGATTTLNGSCSTWYPDSLGNTVLATGSSFTATISSDTTFYLEENGCGTPVGRTPVHVTVVPLPATSIANSNSAACVGESVTLTPVGFSTYSWTSPATGAAPFQLFVLLGTSYSVTGTDLSGCENSAIITIIPNLCSGLNEEENYTAGLVVYPNPGTGNLTLRAAEALDLELVNELGQTLRAFSLRADTNFGITLEDLPAGVYFLTGEHESRIVNKKVIVIR